MLIKVRRFVFGIFVFHLCYIFSQLFPNTSHFNLLRGWMFSFFMAKSGKRLMVARDCVLNSLSEMVVGDDVYIAHGVWINAAGGLDIKSGVVISPKVVIATTRHRYENGKVCLRHSDRKPIVIGEGCWISSGSVITMGVSVGDGSVVGANSVVTKNVDPYMLVAGAPCKVVKKIS